MRSPAEQPADELLVMRCQDGEAESLADLVARWQRRLWRHACRLTGREDAAWEVSQEAWLSIIRGLGRLDDPASFPTWAFRIVMHKAADWVRARERARQGREELASEPPARPDRPSGPEDCEDIHAALRRLTHDQREVLTLHYLEGFAVAEIAAILAVPGGTVKSRLHAAREELRRIWRRP